MTTRKFALGLLVGSFALLSLGAEAARAQSHVDSVDPSLGAPSVSSEESHIGDLTGHAAAGKLLYRRYCIGCHGPAGDGNGMNAQWIDPKPRDFTEAIFKCRSTPTGTLPTDQDLYNAIERGFVTSNMPSWTPLTKQQRADLVAFIKTWSPRWAKEKSGDVLVIPAETPVTIESISHGRELFQKLECWKCHGPAGHGDGPSAATLTDSKDNPIRPYNFSVGTRFKCGETNQDIYRIFMTGVDGTPMPSFHDVIQPADAWDLVHFLRTLQVTLPTKESDLWKGYAASHGKDLKPIGPDAAGGGQ
jgi:mono/diheme cytochrome c family protein